jgi:hypothetical protein
MADAPVRFLLMFDYTNNTSFGLIAVLEQSILTRIAVVLQQSLFKL